MIAPLNCTNCKQEHPSVFFLIDSTGTTILHRRMLFACRRCNTEHEITLCSTRSP